MNQPVQLFEGHRDLEVVSQHVEGGEDVGPLHHLPQRTPLQHLGTEDVPRLLRQEADVNEDLSTEGKQQRDNVTAGSVFANCPNPCPNGPP